VLERIAQRSDVMRDNLLLYLSFYSLRTNLLTFVLLFRHIDSLHFSTDSACLAWLDECSMTISLLFFDRHWMAGWRIIIYTRV